MHKTGQSVDRLHDILDTENLSPSRQGRAEQEHEGGLIMMRESFHVASCCPKGASVSSASVLMMGERSGHPDRS